MNADGEMNARSEPSDVVGSNAAPLTNTSRPTITGTARVGDELTANEGTWTGNPTSFSFQWQRCDIDAITCISVTGATGRTYGVRLADLGFRLRVVVTAHKNERSGTATSALTGVVQPTTRSRTSGRRCGFSASSSWGRASTCVCASATTSRAISPSSCARQSLACGPHFVASRPVWHRVRAARTPVTGFRRSASVGQVGTRSRCGHGMCPASRASRFGAPSAGSGLIAQQQRGAPLACGAPSRCEETAGSWC
jgi:hypothetical protein